MERANTQVMSLSPIEKEELMESLGIEIGNMFDRLSGHYSGSSYADHALLLPELENQIKNGLLEQADPT